MAEPEEAAAAPEKKHRRSLIVPAIVLAIGLGAGGYFYVNGRDSAVPADPTTTTTIGLGKIVRLQPLTLNLSDGHVLKVGLALQLVEKPKDKELSSALSSAGHASDNSSPLHGQEAKALDEAIHILGDSTFTALSSPGGRAAAKEVLSHKIKEVYEGDVVDVYFTDFVMS